MEKKYISSKKYLSMCLVFGVVICIGWGLMEYGINSYIDYQVESRSSVETDLLHADLKAQIEALEAEKLDMQNEANLNQALYWTLIEGRDKELKAFKDKVKELSSQ